MANANQVIVNGETILDLRSDTVTPETLQKGYTAHDKSGTKITGTLEASSVSVQPSKSVTITSNGTATITPDAGYDAMSSVDVTVNVSGGGSSGGGGYLAGIDLSRVESPLTLKDMSVVNCIFNNGSYDFTIYCSNVTFSGCAFQTSYVSCTQEIHDAIVNGENNDYSTSSFTII